MNNFQKKIFSKIAVWNLKQLYEKWKMLIIVCVWVSECAFRIDEKSNGNGTHDTLVIVAGKIWEKT